MMSKKWFAIFSFLVLIISFGVAQETFTVNYFEPKGDAFRLGDGTEEILINGTGYNATDCEWRFEAWSYNGTKVTDEAGTSGTQGCSEILVNPSFPESTETWPGAYDSPDYYQLNFTIMDDNVTTEEGATELWIDDVTFPYVNLQEYDDVYRLFSGAYATDIGINNYFEVEGTVRHIAPGIVNLTFGDQNDWWYYGGEYSNNQLEENFSWNVNLEPMGSTEDLGGEFRHGYEYDMVFYNTKWDLSPRTVNIVDVPVPYNEWNDYINYDHGSAPSEVTGYGSYKISDYPPSESFGLDVRDFDQSCELVVTIFEEYPYPGEREVYQEAFSDSDCSTDVKYISEAMDNVFNTSLIDNERGVYRIETEYLEGFNPALPPGESYHGEHFVAFEKNPLPGSSDTNDAITSGNYKEVNVSLEYQFMGTGSVDLVVENLDTSETFVEPMPDDDSFFAPSKLASGQENPESTRVSHTFNLSTGNYSARVEVTDDNGNEFNTDDYEFSVSEMSESYVSQLNPNDGETFSYTEDLNNTSVSFEWETGAFEQSYLSKLWVYTGESFELFDSYTVNQGEATSKTFEMNFSEGSYTWKVNASGLNDGSEISSEVRSFTVSEVSSQFDVSFSDMSPVGQIVWEDLEDSGIDEKKLYFNFSINSSNPGLATIMLDDGEGFSPIKFVSVSEGVNEVVESITVGEGNIGETYRWKVNVTSDVSGDVIESEEYEYTILYQDDIEPEKNIFGKFLDSIIEWMASVFGVSFKMGKFLVALLITIIFSSFVAWATNDGGAFTFSMVVGLIFFTVAGYFPKTYVIILALIGALILAFFSRNMIDWGG